MSTKNPVTIPSAARDRRLRNSPRLQTLRRLIARQGVRLLRPSLETMIDGRRLYHPLVVGPPERIHLGENAFVSDAILNAVSGSITVERDAFFGQNVMIAAGTHEPELFGETRFRNPPSTGRDVLIREGAWIASRAIVIGPCVIGQHAVVAAGSVVTRDVEPYTMVAGVPARLVRRLTSSAID